MNDNWFLMFGVFHVWFWLWEIFVFFQILRDLLEADSPKMYTVFVLHIVGNNPFTFSLI